jgi:hypothetical protein
VFPRLQGRGRIEASLFRMQLFELVSVSTAARSWPNKTLLKSHLRFFNRYLRKNKHQKPFCLKIIPSRHEELKWQLTLKTNLFPLIKGGAFSPYFSSILIKSKLIFIFRGSFLMIRIKRLSHLVKLLDLTNTQIVIGGKKHLVIDLNLMPKSSKSQPLLDLLAKNLK